MNSRLSEYLTRDGYPTSDTLLLIETFVGTPTAWLDFVCSVWYYPDQISKHSGMVIMNTGGWSGNEEIVDAMRRNRVQWSQCWISSPTLDEHIFCGETNVEIGRAHV